jgi:hypothetical protein
MSFKVGDKIRVTTAISHVISMGTIGTLVKNRSDIGKGVWDVSFAGHSSDILFFEDDFELLTQATATPLPYSGQQLTFKPLDPTAQLVESVPCTCGPKFLDDAHKKECGMKDVPK